MKSAMQNTIMTASPYLQQHLTILFAVLNLHQHSIVCRNMHKKTCQTFKVFKSWGGEGGGQKRRIFEGWLQ